MLQLRPSTAKSTFFKQTKNEVSSLASVILYLSMDPQLITILDMHVMTQLMSFFPLDCKLHEHKDHVSFWVLENLQDLCAWHITPVLFWGKGLTSLS